MSRVDQLIALLPGSIGDDPAAQDFLQGLLTPVARVEAYYNLRTRALQELLDPELCPDELVPHLAALVGVGLDLPASNLATTAELRRLVVVAIALWKEKGNRESWRDVVSVLAGKRALILDWFYLRLVQGSFGELHVLPRPGSAPGGSYDYPENVTDLWYMDPEGMVNGTLVQRFLDVCRPAGERINVYVGLLVDDGGAGWGLWTLTGAGTSTWAAAAQTLTLANDARAVMAVGGSEATWAAYHAFLRLAVTGVAEVRLLHADALNAYVVAVDQGLGTVELFREVAGVRTSLVAVAQAQAAGFPYRWSFEVEAGTTGTLVRAIFEAAVLFDLVDVDAARMTAGPAGYEAPAGQVVALSTALVFPFNVRPTRVGPSP